MRLSLPRSSFSPHWWPQLVCNAAGGSVWAKRHRGEHCTTRGGPRERRFGRSLMPSIPLVTLRADERTRFPLPPYPLTLLFSLPHPVDAAAHPSADFTPAPSFDAPSCLGGPHSSVRVFTTATTSMGGDGETASVTHMRATPGVSNIEVGATKLKRAIGGGKELRGDSLAFIEEYCRPESVMDGAGIRKNINTASECS